MAVNPSVVNSLKRVYTKAQLETALAQATADFLSGVQITQVTFEGGGATGRPISGDPSYLLEHVEAAIAQLEDADLQHQPTSAFMDLSKRQFGT